MSSIITAKRLCLWYGKVRALKIITDMERIGDHAVNIARWVIFSVTGAKEVEQ